MRPLLTFTTVLLGSTIFVAHIAYGQSATDLEDAMAEANAATDTNTSITLQTNQTISSDKNQLYNQLKVTGNGYGITGSMVVSDDSTTGSTKQGNLDISGIGNVNITVSDGEIYTVNSSTNEWTNGYTGSISNGAVNVDTAAQAALRVDADATVKNVVFANSVISGEGGAVLVTGTGKFDTNAGAEGSDPVYSRTDTTVTFDNNYFIQNIAENGGAFDLNSALTTADSVSGNYFIQNDAANHAGAIDAGGIIKDLSQNVFYNNTAMNNSGAVFVHSGAVIEKGTNNIFSTNYALEGGALAIETGGKTTLSNTTFINNKTSDVVITEAGQTTDLTGKGGAVYNVGNLTLDGNTTFTGNKAGIQGGAIYNEGILTLTGTGNGITFNGNSAGMVGDVDANQSSGGAIYNTGDLTLDGKVNLTGNSTALNGGAIYNTGTLTLKGSDITFSGNNLNTGFGKDIYNEGTVNFTDVTDTIDTTDGHVTFDTANGLYNEGTFKFSNSRMQLHQGINSASNKSGTINIENSSLIDLGPTGTIYADIVTLSGGSTIQTHVQNLTVASPKNGSISTNTIEFKDDTNQLKILVDSGSIQAGEHRDITVVSAGSFEDDSDKFNIVKNNMYDIERVSNGVYRISLSGSNPTVNVPTNGCDDNECATAIGWLSGNASGFEDGTLARDVYNKLNELAQFGKGCTDEEYRDALDAIAPDVSPLIRSHITEINRRLYSIISNRLYSSMERTGYIFRGRRYYRFPQQQSHLWVQGIYANSKYDVRKGFDGDDTGIAIGFDGHVSEALRMGLGYSYTQGDYNSIGRKTDIDSHTGMFYGEYNPNRFFVNWLATYTRSSYSEDKSVFNQSVKADYDVDAIGAQVMVGQKMGPYVNGNWSTGVFMPEVGLRYLYTKQGAYTDTLGQEVDEADGSSLTGILGLQYTIGYTLSPNVAFYPELRAAVTYDIVESDVSTKVNLMNGNVYEVKEETMDRLGFEVGGRLGLDINRKTELSLEYEGVFRGDYTNHTGLANMKYKF